MLSASSQIGVLDAQVRLAKKLFWISLRSQYPHEREDVETYARGPRPVGREILPSREDFGYSRQLRPGRSPGLRSEPPEKCPLQPKPDVAANREVSLQHPETLCPDFSF